MSESEARRNPFPSLNDTEYELLMEKMEGAAERGAQKAVDRMIRNNCERHQQQTQSIMAAVFGRSEHGIVGIDERMNRVEAFERRVTRLTWLVVGQVVVLIGTVSLALFNWSNT